MANDRPVPVDVSIYIEQEGGNKYKLQSAHLEQIGALLRGKTKFSVFYSIILPVIISVATVIFSSIFQYVSWINSVRLQKANEQAANAAATYEKAASAIGKRYYATYVFLSAAQQLASWRIEEGNNLYKSAMKLNQRRFDFYYDQLRAWNENYDALLTEVDYNLDRPIFLQVGMRSDTNRITLAKTRDVDCTKSLTEEMERVGLNRHSLKGQFAVIKQCFVGSIAAFDAEKDRAILDSAVTIDDAAKSKANDNLDDIHSIANVFRCHALRRVEYYNSQKESAILSVNTVVQRFVDLRAENANKHFETVDQRCEF